jgi:hypothetical protein
MKISQPAASTPPHSQKTARPTLQLGSITAGSESSLRFSKPASSRSPGHRVEADE